MSRRSQSKYFHPLDSYDVCAWFSTHLFSATWYWRNVVGAVLYFFWDSDAMRLNCPSDILGMKARLGMRLKIVWDFGQIWGRRLKNTHRLFVILKIKQISFANLMKSNWFFLLSTSHSHFSHFFCTNLIYKIKATEPIRFILCTPNTA